MPEIKSRDSNATPIYFFNKTCVESRDRTASKALDMPPRPAKSSTSVSAKTINVIYAAIKLPRSLTNATMEFYLKDWLAM